MALTPSRATMEPTITKNTSQKTTATNSNRRSSDSSNTRKRRTMRKTSQRMDISGHSECSATSNESELSSSAEFKYNNSSSSKPQQEQQTLPENKKKEVKMTSKTTKRSNPKRTSSAPTSSNANPGAACAPSSNEKLKRKSAPPTRGSKPKQKMASSTRSKVKSKSFAAGVPDGPTLEVLPELPSKGPKIQRYDTRDSMLPNPGIRPNNGLRVRFAGESGKFIESAKHDPTLTWYSKEDLAMLLDHEMKIALRALERPQKALHCCWRGLEHIQRRVDKAEHVAQHVLSVLVIHHDLKKQQEDGKVFKKEPAEILRIKSKQITKEDRKWAYKYGLQDATETSTSLDLDKVMEEVRAEHAARWALLERASRRRAPRTTIIEKSVRGLRNIVHSPEKKSTHQRNYRVPCPN